MTTTGSTGNGPDPGDSSWTDETLPMSLRKELLNRELQKYSARRAPAAAASPSRAHQNQDGGSSHPNADAPSAAGHPD